MKKIMAVIISVLIIASLAGCAGSSGGESETTTAPVKVDINGVLMSTVKQGEDQYYENSQSYKCREYTVTLDVLDVDSGEVTSFKTFTNKDTLSCSVYQNGSLNNSYLAKTMFSNDFTKITAMLTMKDGTTHVGWADENGEFTDVTDAVSDGDSNDLRPCFGADGYFYFETIVSDKEYQIKRAPINNPSPDSVEVVKESDEFMEFFVSADGNVDSMYLGWIYYDGNTDYPAYFQNFSDWVNEKECIGVETSKICLYELSGEKDSDSWYSSKTVLPSASETSVDSSPVVSPDGDRVAFISRTTDASGFHDNPCVTEINGEAKQIDADYDFTNCCFIGWY